MRLSYSKKNQTINVPEVRGVEYRINGKPVNGQVKISKTTKVVAVPTGGYRFPEGANTEWTFEVEDDKKD